MSKNFVHEGKVLELTAPRTHSSGTGALIGYIFGIALRDYTSGDLLCQYGVAGVWDLAKDSSVFSAGDLVYWDNSAYAATSTAGSNQAIGQAELAAVTGASTVRVRLTPNPTVLAMSGLGVTATAAEINVLHSVVAGTARASSGVVLDAAKSIDVAQITSSLSLGGTGVPAAANVQTDITKRVTGLTDTTATDCLTVTVPNAQHAAIINVDVLGILGAGGTVGAGEGVRLSKYQVVLARTAGLACVATVSSGIGGAESHVAGAANVTSVVVTASAMTGANSAQQTFTIKVAITKSGGASDNHVALIHASILNENATGVTVA